MKFLEGKNPAEKKKIIAAIILGTLAFLVVGYNFYGMFFAGKPKTTTTVKNNSNSNTSANSNTSNNSNNATTAQVLEPIPPPDQVYADNITTPVLYSPSDFFGPIGSRNIFAFYEPPPSTPYIPTPVPVHTVTPPPQTPEITPKPAPTPNVMLGFMSPQSVYAGSKSFLLELNGNNFLPETLIFINSMQIPTNYVNGQKLTANIDQSMIASAGTFNIEVKSVDGKWFSNVLQMQIQQAPQPEYDYVGLISRQRANNDTAYLQPKNSKDPPVGVRLNDTIGGRFRVMSISSKEIVLKDKDLGFEYRKPLYRITQNGGKPGSGGSTGSQPNNNCPPGIPCNQPMTMQNPQTMGCPPGIPCNPSQNMRQPQPNSKEPDDEDDEDNN